MSGYREETWEQAQPQRPGQPTGQGLQLIEEMTAEVRRHRDHLAAVLPRGATLQQIMQDALNCLRDTKDLALVHRPTFVGAMMTCASLGLRPGVPGLGHAWLIPFRNSEENGRLDAKLIIGYQGYKDLAYRHPKVVAVESKVVHAADTFDIDIGENLLTHKPPPLGVPRGPVIGFYALAKIQGPYGTERILTEPMSLAEMEEHRDLYAMHRTWENGRRVVAGTWIRHFIPMGKKTMIRARLVKEIPIALDLATALAVDEGFRTNLNPDADPARVTRHPSDEPPPIDPRAPVREAAVIRPPKRDGGITPDQDRRIARLMRQRGMTKEAALDLVQRTIGERRSARQLSEKQADQVIEAIEALPIDGAVLTPDREDAEQRIVALFDGLDSPLSAERRLRDLSTLLGRDIRTPADVTYAELSDIADVLTACKGQTAEWDAVLRAAADQRKAGVT
ncbi:recombinase RecT [Nonomuraea angiospora]|uniref:recombinase RecT n=1 Tax=Nonomuraea angiospora TaxID=46172 RepID=UPI0029B06D5B|nr:recombinase RecT [Nonomuraea angiospora]MDX3100508.1 recombinase RecT [Nonomuraea angiospora]